jgi:hypothetical protein
VGQPAGPRWFTSRRVVSALTVGVIAVSVTISLTPVAAAGSGGDTQRVADAAAAQYLERVEVTQAPLPLHRCAKASDKAGWSGTDLLIATAVSMAESGCNPSATGTNPPTEGCPDGSRDRGIFQINDCYHSEVTDECAYDLQCNADAAYQIYRDASSTFQPWTAYKLRLFKAYLNEARKAVKRVTGENIVVGVVMTEGGSLNVRNKPRTSGDLVGQLADNAVVRIKCQTKGESIYSPIFDYETKIWDSDGPGRYFSDAYVYTDTRKMVAPRC